MNQTIIDLMEKLGYPKPDVRICIETGTYLGEGALTFADYFDEVITIELSEELYSYNIEYNKHSKIKYLNGESSEILSKVISGIPILSKYFLFLDAHGSGENTTFSPKYGRYGSPVLEEIKSCILCPPECLVVDDFKDFNNYNYPSTQDIIQCVTQLGNYEMEIINKYNGLLIFQKK